MKQTANRIIESTFLDSGIYPGNRNFRLLLSSKFLDRGERPFQLYVANTGAIVSIDKLTYPMFRCTLAGCNGSGNPTLLPRLSNQPFSMALKVSEKRRKQNSGLSYVPPDGAIPDEKRSSVSPPRRRASVVPRDANVPDETRSSPTPPPSTPREPIAKFPNRNAERSSQVRRVRVAAAAHQQYPKLLQQFNAEVLPK